MFSIVCIASQCTLPYIISLSTNERGAMVPSAFHTNFIQQKSLTTHVWNCKKLPKKWVDKISSWILCWLMWSPGGFVQPNLLIQRFSTNTQIHYHMNATSSQFQPVTTFEKEYSDSQGRALCTKPEKIIKQESSIYFKVRAWINWKECL